MTEQAKKAAYLILRKYIDIRGWSAHDIKSAATHIGNIVDAEFAEVVKERDAAEEDAHKQNVALMDALMRESALEKALGELVEAEEAVEAALLTRETLMDKDALERWMSARNLKVTALAAAEKLLEEDDGTQSQ